MKNARTNFETCLVVNIMKNFLQIPNTMISVHHKLQTSWCLIKMRFVMIGLITDERVLLVKE